MINIKMESLQCRGIKTRVCISCKRERSGAIIKSILKSDQTSKRLLLSSRTIGAPFFMRFHFYEALSLRNTGSEGTSYRDSD